MDSAVFLLLSWYLSEAPQMCTKLIQLYSNLQRVLALLSTYHVVLLSKEYSCCDILLWAMQALIGLNVVIGMQWPT